MGRVQKQPQRHGFGDASLASCTDRDTSSRGGLIGNGDAEAIPTKQVKMTVANTLICIIAWSFRYYAEMKVRSG